MSKRIFCYIIQVILLILTIILNNFLEGFLQNVSINFTLIYIIFLVTFSDNLSVFLSIFVLLIYDISKFVKYGRISMAYFLLILFFTYLRRFFNNKEKLYFSLKIFFGTILFNLILIFLEVIFSSTRFKAFEIILFLKKTLIESLINFMASILLYSIILRFGIKLSKAFNIDQIITKYFDR